MKILQLIHATQLRGAEIFACQLTDHLRQLGNEVFIVALYDKGCNMPTSTTVTCLKAKHGVDFKALAAFSAFIRDNEIELVQTNAGDTLKFASLSKIIFRWNAKLVVRNATTMSELLRHKLHKASYRLLFSRVDHIISVSRYNADDIRMLFPASANKTSVIPIGIDSQTPLPKTRAAKHPILLHVAALNREKNHEGLLRIFSRIKKEIPTAQLWLVGEGPLKYHVEDLIALYDLTENVHLLGKRNDVRALMRTADMLVLPSLTEGLPGVILEAMDCELPVVAYNTGGIKEVVETHATGWLIEKHNEDAFCNAIKEVLYMSVIGKQRIVENAKQRVAEEYNNTHICKTFNNLYRTLLQSSVPV